MQHMQKLSLTYLTNSLNYWKIAHDTNKIAFTSPSPQFSPQMMTVPPCTEAAAFICSLNHLSSQFYSSAEDRSRLLLLTFLACLVLHCKVKWHTFICARMHINVCSMIFDKNIQIKEKSHCNYIQTQQSDKLVSTVSVYLH